MTMRKTLSWKFWENLGGISFIITFLGMAGVVGGFAASLEFGVVTEVSAWGIGASAVAAGLGLLTSWYASRCQDKLKDQE
jgi:hypothetical protein